MSYSVNATCDYCGCGYKWKDITLNKTSAIRIVRGYGWQVGKKGWICPECKKEFFSKRKSKK